MSDAASAHYKTRSQVEALFAVDAGAAAAAVMVQIRTPGGELRTLEVSVAPLRTGDQSVAGYAGFAVDVSERQLALGKLQSQLDTRLD